MKDTTYQTGLTLLVSLSILLSCKEDITTAEDNQIKSAKVMTPLAVGNEWVYKYTFKGVEKSWDDTIRIVKKLTIDNEEWFLATHSDRMRTWTEELMRNTDSGLEIKDNDPKYHFSRLVKYPLTINDVFLMQSKFRMTGGGNNDYTWNQFKRVNAIKSIVNPCGQFQCYELLDTLSNNENYSGLLDYHNADYYYPGIGLIKHIEYQTDYSKGYTFSENGNFSTVELISYTLKK